jgi:hypothetical protein
MRSLPKSLKKLLDAETGEVKIVQFLAKHPQLLCDYFVSPRGHCQYGVQLVSQVWLAAAFGRGPKGPCRFKTIMSLQNNGSGLLGIGLP